MRISDWSSDVCSSDLQVRGMNVLGTLAHYPALARAFSTFNAHVAGSSTLQVRDREIVILRLSWLRRSEYEYGQHVILGKRSEERRGGKECVSTGRSRW